MRGWDSESIGLRLWFVLLLLTAILANMGLYVRFEERVNQANRIHHQTRELIEEIKQFGDDRTRMAYSYVATGDERYRDLHRQLVDVRQGALNLSRDYRGYFWSLDTPRHNQRSSEPRKPFLQRMREAGFNDDEIGTLLDVREEGDETVRLEKQAIAIVAARGFDDGGREAAAILWGPRYRSLKADVMQTLRIFRNRVEQRTLGGIADAERDAHWLRASLLLVTLLMLGSLFWVRGALYRATGGSLRQLTQLIDRLPSIDARTAPLPIETGRAEPCSAN